MTTRYDPQAKALLDQLTAYGAHTPSPTHPPSPAEIAAATRQAYRGAISLAGAPQVVFRVEDREIPGQDGSIPIRVYSPREAGDLLTLVYFHGGSFIAGDLETHDAPLRQLANESDCIIVAVAYRLAPEHPFPAALDDCYTATVWAAEHAAEFGGVAGRIAVGGDSAGGCLAAAVTLKARERRSPELVCQVLIYPDTDLTESTSSWHEFATANAPIITREGKLAAVSMYVPEGVDIKHPLVSPLYAEDLRGMPPALVITGECDPQRDEGEQYAARLKGDGVPITHTRYPGMIHGFFQMAGALDAGKRAIREVADYLKKARDVGLQSNTRVDNRF